MIAVVLVLAGLSVLAFDAADFSFSGLSILALILIVVGLWVGGAFERSKWIADEPDDAPPSRLVVLDGRGQRGPLSEAEWAALRASGAAMIAQFDAGAADGRVQR